LNGTKKDSLKFEHLPNFSPIPKMIGAKPRQLVRFNVGYVSIFPFQIDNNIFSRDSFLNSKLKYFLGPDRSYEYLTMGLKEELALFFDQLFTLNRCIEFGAGSNPHIREQVGLQLNSLMINLMDNCIDENSVIMKRLKEEYAELIKEMELIEEIFKDAEEQPPLPEEIARRYRFVQNEHGRWKFFDRL
jgi:hypothetical protein